MRKLAEVEDARRVMTEGINWGIWKWLTEKKNVRIIADKATAALDAAEDEAKSAWSDELKAAYNILIDQAEAIEHPKAKRRKSRGKKKPTQAIDPESMAVAKRVFEADELAERTRLEAEDIFDEADRKLSTSMAKDGCRKALETYDLHEKAIRKAEAASRSRQAGSGR